MPLGSVLLALLLVTEEVSEAEADEVPLSVEGGAMVEVDEEREKGFEIGARCVSLSSSQGRLDRVLFVKLRQVDLLFVIFHDMSKSS